MIILCKIISNNFYRYSSFEKLEQNSPLLNCGLKNGPFTKGIVWNFTRGKLGKRYFRQVMRVKINSDTVMLTVCTHDMMC